MELGRADVVGASQTEVVPRTCHVFVVALVIAAHHELAEGIQRAQTQLLVVIHLAVASTQRQSAEVVVGSQVVAILASSGLLVQVHRSIDRQASEAGRTVADLVGGAQAIEPDWVLVEGVRGGARVMVVHAHIVSRSVVRLGREVTQADHTEAAGQVHFALACERHAGGGVGPAGTRAGVRIETAFQLEASLQATAQVFRALETKAGRVVEHAGGGHIAQFLAFHGGVDAAIQRYAALGHGGGGAGNSQDSQDNAGHFLHENSFETSCHQ